MHFTIGISAHKYTQPSALSSLLQYYVRPKKTRHHCVRMHTYAKNGCKLNEIHKDHMKRAGGKWLRAYQICSKYYFDSISP